MEIQIESEKVCKQLRDQKTWKWIKDGAQDLLYVEQNLIRTKCI